ncbi:MAG: SDR family NAD(P)-dependent oxidoreductase, partial [Burkholderiales bacterium]
MDLQLKGKTAFITGGSMGIGKAAAFELASEGVNVAIAARRLPLLEEAATELRSRLGPDAGRILPVAVDTTDMDSVTQGMAAAAEVFGRIDILVNGAAHPGGLVRA